ncbi:unnamed protein product [Cylindrotheca closterium]|uniref:Calmodulin n=1 Tax=Cylindrotheca closterium TaxID=2856 RepID=A0AAD2CSL8_9STRA|nr:unnamed protein product [Cylindrotheca closterium]
MGTCSSKSSAVAFTKPHEGVLEIEYSQPLKGSHGSDGSGDNKTAATQPSTPVGRSPKKDKVSMRGYSSGGSSECSDGDINVSCHGHLMDWKQELQSNSGPGRARIETDYGRPIEEVYGGVHNGEVLGTGISGVVRKVKHRTTGVEYAVKCLDLGLIREERALKALKDEIFIMCQLDHPSIVRLEEVYESDTEMYLIQELCTGGDMFDRLDAQEDYHYTEAECARLVKQMLSSVRYLHSKKIIHRDLKLENFLFSSPEANSPLKMIDFGLSKHFTHLGELQHECVGTPYTVAPEVIRAEYDEKIDCWALGVIVYLLLSGETPFGGVDGEDLQTVRTNILSGHVVFEPAEIWDHVSNEGKAFVKRLLNPNSKVRPTAKEAQLDPWLQKFGKKGSGEGSKLSPKVISALVEFREYSAIRKALCEVLSFTLLPEQISEMREEFEKIDDDGDGEISLLEFKQVLTKKAGSTALGPLTEDQLDDLFNELRSKKSDESIRFHEFIAASLSQCNFDERNVKLAFDRLDYDRTGFITFQDVKDLFGSGNESDDMFQMWQEGMTEYACPLGRITYDDFRMILKGRGRELEQPTLIKRTPLPKVSEGSPLPAVPEGSMSPQVKHAVFAKFEKSPPSLKMPSLDGLPEAENDPLKPSVDTKFPLDILPPSPTHRRIRSGSLGSQPLSLRSSLNEADLSGIDHLAELTEDEEDDEDGASGEMSLGPIELHSCRSLEDHVSPMTRSWSDFPSERTNGGETFKQHNDFRRSILKASRTFEAKVLARKLQMAAAASNAASQPLVDSRASLIMRRGTQAQRPEVVQIDSSNRQRSDSPASSVGTSDKQATATEVAAACKRGGRPRRERRKRTTSDISGMLK